jgi:hypothetical protein
MFTFQTTMGFLRRRNCELFEEFIDALKEVNYCEYIVMEYEPGTDGDCSLKNAPSYISSMKIGMNGFQILHNIREDRE